MPERKLLCGWGRTAATAVDVVTPTHVSDITATMRQELDRGVVARGLGRSYGDAAQNAGGVVLDMTGRRAVHHIDPHAGVVDADAGVSLDELLSRILPLGWFVPVSPGTRYVTLGGALAADVHGKNHHRDGAFGAHVRSFELVSPDGSGRTVDPDVDAELFWATAGGMGLTGVVTRLRLALLPVQTAYMRVDTERASDLDDLLDRLARTDDNYRYSVAWIDLLARGRHQGRAVLTRGNHAHVDDLPPAQRSDPFRWSTGAGLNVPPIVPGGLLRRPTVAAFNEMWFRKAPRERRGDVQPLAAFFYPLDGLRNWNRVYGAGGLVQYQYVVPPDADGVVRASVGMLSSAGVPSFLAVLKRFGPADPGPLAFPMPGWTLALDLPARTPGLAGLLDRLDDLVAGAGGRVYLAKDSRLSPELLPVMYPRLPEWRELRARVDPQRRLISDLARRLGL